MKFISRIVFFVLFLLPTLNLKAQILDQRLIIGASFGVGLPQQNFGKSDTVGRKDTTKVKGWATTGINFHVKAGWKFYKHFGLMAQAGGNVNWFNSSAYESQLLGNPILQNQVAVNATAHYIGSYLGGPFFNFPINSIFSIDAHVLVGLMTAKYSVVSPIVNFDGSTYNESVSYTVARCLGYDAEIGLKANLMDQVALILTCGYLGGNPVFGGYSVSYSSGPPLLYPGAPAVSYNNARTSTMSTGIINISAGAVFSFF